jgi:hypothetical protein
MPFCIPSFRAELFRRRWPILAVMTLGLGGAVFVLGEPDNTASPAAGGSSLTIEQIGDALDSYGKNTTTLNGHTEYHLNVHKGKKNVNVTVSLSPSGKVIWMTSSLAPVPEAGKVAPAALLAILKKNTEIGPMFFSIANGSLSISNPVANQDESAGAVAAQVEALISTVLDTEDLWKPQTLSAEPAVVPAASPAPDGQNPSGK